IVAVAEPANMTCNAARNRRSNNNQPRTTKRVTAAQILIVIASPSSAPAARPCHEATNRCEPGAAAGGWRQEAPLWRGSPAVSNDRRKQLGGRRHSRNHRTRLRPDRLA